MFDSENIRSHNSCDNRTLIEMGLPFFNTTQQTYGHYKLSMEQNMENIIIDGLTITEKDSDPLDTKYIRVYDTVENLILKNVIIVKKQAEENGTLLYFEKNGSVENLICENIHTKGLKELTNDKSKIKDTF